MILCKYVSFGTGRRILEGHAIGFSQPEHFNDPFDGRGIEVGGTFAFPRDHFEKLQRVFLYKPIPWAYEEEVRVVKCIKGLSRNTPSNQSGNFQVSDIGDRDLYIFQMPQNAILELYLGFRSPDDASDGLYHDALHRHPYIAVYQRSLDSSALSVSFDNYRSAENPNG